MSKAIRNILLVVVLITIISTISYCAAPYDTEQAQIVEIKKTITGSGFLLRKETPIKRDITGIFEAVVKDGMRVARGSSVGMVVSGNLDKELAKQLEDVTERIKEIKNSDNIAGLYSSDDARIFSAMKDLSASVRKFAYEENYVRAEEYKNQLTALIEKKYSSGSLEARDSLLVSLEAEKYSLEQQLGGIRSSVSAPVAGIFYTELDGLESLCDENELAKYTASDINGFSQTLENYKKDESILGKIADNYTWYIASVISLEDAQQLAVGETISISVNDSPFIEATVLSIVPDAQEAAIIIKSKRNAEGITEKRTAEFEIQLKKSSGIYVPAAALRVVDDITGVYVMDSNNSIYFRCVDIVHKDENYYIVKNKYIPPKDCNYKALKVYEDILVNPEAVRSIDKHSKKPE